MNFFEIWNGENLFFLCFEPTMFPSCSCFDLKPPNAPNGIWHDAQDPRYTCNFYKAFPQFCTEYGDQYEQYGLVAQQACCVCQGGGCAVIFL